MDTTHPHVYRGPSGGSIQEAEAALCPILTLELPVLCSRAGRRFLNLLRHRFPRIALKLHTTVPPRARRHDVAQDEAPAEDRQERCYGQ